MTINIEVPDTFSGPLDLLLYLVRREEIDLHAIPMARLTKTYLAEIESRGLIDVDNGGEFLAMATTLLEIKSRDLLPTMPDGGNPEDADGETLFDPRQGLVKALLAYKGFKQAAAALAETAAENSARFARQISDDFPSAAIEPEIHSAWELFAAFQKIAQKLVADQRRREIVNDEISTELRISQIEDALAKKSRVTFSDLLSENPDRGELVGFFIAILELVRLKKVIARQAIDFSEIYLHSRITDESASDEPKIAREYLQKLSPMFTAFSSNETRKISAATANKKKITHPIFSAFSAKNSIDRSQNFLSSSSEKRDLKRGKFISQKIIPPFAPTALKRAITN